MDQFPHRDITMITGDFNAKLGQKTTGETFLGPHARGTRIRNGHLMAAFCDIYQLFATNTAFPKRAKNKTTWSQRKRSHCVYNQIDYVLCPQSCRRFCLDAQSWGGAITPSDHKIVTADFELKHIRRLRFPSRRTSGTTVHLARSELVHSDDSRTAYASATLTIDPLSTCNGRTLLRSYTKQHRRPSGFLRRINDAAAATTIRCSPRCPSNNASSGSAFSTTHRPTQRCCALSETRSYTRSALAAVTSLTWPSTKRFHASRLQATVTKCSLPSAISPANRHSSF
ncbi:hypothetical protein PHYSODRAFT_286527 [Phytophthora sojae]|uniref:Endonuclease/exonuclease/phosphatase domain-containing protein n=1 Tax=Phytophthora sojae (strain P6497) TaxID=1094619 RepID=G4ZSA1_PHYSP|nr:hypothetical protein PHYSODRAFT_286527 [Phytophthora sojae]EGZ12997.1 hypothetical protein PHYSODRAFT_286527 [Phytophthora sojae]|eukprot:XP_009530426.1 hypothetical protein PHYSODRAFT_286527 [Phytophthora sojae]